MKNIYITSDGLLERKENTIYFVRAGGERRPIPISKIYGIYVYGSLSITSQALHLLAMNGVPIHFFNHYGYYEGSFYPRERLVSGDLLVKQVEHFLNKEKRLKLARAFVEGAAGNMMRNLMQRGQESRKEEIASILSEIESAKKITELMNIEARMRIVYYESFNDILPGDFKFERRSRQRLKMH